MRAAVADRRPRGIRTSKPSFAKGLEYRRLFATEAEVFAHEDHAGIQLADLSSLGWNSSGAGSHWSRVKREGRGSRRCPFLTMRRHRSSIGSQEFGGTLGATTQARVRVEGQAGGFETFSRASATAATGVPEARGGPVENSRRNGRVSTP